ncbi:MAG: hypothetical protein KJ592_01515 [Nanoarchaeota archaeon]|nr:hypothetical protein [Nanoarchaeota archaeon]
MVKSQKILNLENQIKRELELTGLVKDIEFGGELFLKDNHFYFQYRINPKNKSKNPKKSNKIKMSQFRHKLLELMMNNFSEFYRFSQESEGEVYRQYFMLYPTVKVEDIENLEYHMLQTIKKEIENYHNQE